MAARTLRRRLVRNALVTCLLVLAVFCYVVPNTALYDRYIRVWDDAAGDLRYYYAVRVTLLVSFVLAAVVAAVLEEPEARTSAVHSQWCRPLLKHRAFAFASGWLLAPFVLAVVAALFVWLWDGVYSSAVDYAWGTSWVSSKHHGRTYPQQMLHSASLYAGVASLVPMTLLGLPLSRSSALWRAAGLSYEEAVSLHRALCHLMMGLLSFHAVGYMIAWVSVSVELLLEELTDWFRCGKCASALRSDPTPPLCASSPDACTPCTCHATRTAHACLSPLAGAHTSTISPDSSRGSPGCSSG